MKVSIIVAMATNRVIGEGNKLPWHIKGDMHRFKEITKGHSVIMGRRTYESIGKALPHRRNVILSRQLGYNAPGALVSASLEEALQTLSRYGEKEVFIIGGEAVYRESLSYAERIYLTLIERDVHGNAYFPAIPEQDFTVVFEERHQGEPPFRFLILDRVSDFTLV